MSMTTEILGQVGPQVAADGSTVTVRQGKSGEQIIQQLHGRYYETSVRRALFSGAATAVTTSSGLATTYTGLCLSNPVGSSVNLAINKISMSFSVVMPTTGTIIGLMTGFSGATNVTHTAAVTPRSQFFNTAGGGVGLLDSSATLPVAPTVNTILGAAITGTAVAVTTIQAPAVIDLEGSIVLPPGAYAAFYTSTAGPTSGGNFSFQWEEIPV